MPGDSSQATLDIKVFRQMSPELKETQNRRYVAMCAIELRPYSMSASPAFQHYLGGFSPAYVTETIHPSTIDRILGELCSEVGAAMKAMLAAQYESVKKMGWTGPWVSLQVDATSTRNTEYYTVSFSWIAEDWSKRKQVAFCTRAFPGRHTAEDVAPWLRNVSNDKADRVIVSSWVQVPPPEYCNSGG